MDTAKKVIWFKRYASYPIFRQHYCQGFPFPISTLSAYNKSRFHRNLQEYCATGVYPEVLMPEVGQTISHYRIMEKIGQGGMGEVYKADTSLLWSTLKARL